MKKYPSISHKIDPDLNIIAFDKLDGSNIRAEWSQKRGLYKFGSRRCMIDENTEILGEAVTLIKEKEQLFADTFNSRSFFPDKPSKVTCFFEFYGPNSFAGQHVETDKKVVTLIDVNIHKKGIMGPKDFVQKFGRIGVPYPVYFGKADDHFVTGVREKLLPGITCEGVVCKSYPRKGHSPIMFKIKTIEWLDKLKNHCGSDEAMYERLV